MARRSRSGTVRNDSLESGPSDDVQRSVKVALREKADPEKSRSWSCSLPTRTAFLSEFGGATQVALDLGDTHAQDLLRQSDFDICGDISGANIGCRGDYFFVGRRSLPLAKCKVTITGFFPGLRKFVLRQEFRLWAIDSGHIFRPRPLECVVRRLRGDLRRQSAKFGRPWRKGDEKGWALRLLSPSKRPTSSPETSCIARPGTFELVTLGANRALFTYVRQIAHEAAK